jgi:hypothetical protein
MVKEKVQKDKQRSTKHAHKTKDRVTLTPLIPGVNSDTSYSTSGTRCVNLLTYYWALDLQLSTETRKYSFCLLP